MVGHIVQWNIHNCMVGCWIHVGGIFRLSSYIWFLGQSENSRDAHWFGRSTNGAVPGGWPIKSGILIFLVSFLALLRTCVLFPKGVSLLVYVRSPNMFHISQDSSLAWLVQSGWRGNWSMPTEHLLLVDNTHRNWFPALYRFYYLIRVWCKHASDTMTELNTKF